MTHIRTAENNGRLWGHSARNWADIQEGQFRAGFVAALDHLGVGAGTRLLDAGCGAGMAAALANARGAQVCGVDAAEAMLAITRERSPQGNFLVGDLEDLPFDDDAFDVVTGFNSFQFAGNPESALREAGRVTKPGGQIAVVTWGDPAGMEAASLLIGVKSIMPPAPPEAPGPFALSDAGNLRAFVAAAGLQPADILDVDSPWFYPDEVTALAGFLSSGAMAAAIEHSGLATTEAACRAAIGPFAQADGSYAIGARCRILFAKVPS